VRLDPDEQALSGDIHEALLFEGISTATLTIEVDHDRVVLRGTVHDQKSADRILAIIERVDGVSSVIDQLTVTGW
jgi:osmotically-inducible protein OsmY